jgi:prepilin-type N-terminal cleavage/methylation domain-containing protein
MYKLNQHNKGFTLIELLVTMAITGILGIGFISLQSVLTNSQITAMGNYLSIESGNNSLTVMMKEIRDARQGETGVYPIEVANDNEIVFYSDIDYDGVVERVRYTYTGSTLTKGVVKPTGVPLAYNIANERVRVLTDIVRNGSEAMFYYYNEDWPSDTVNNPLPPADRISDTRQIKVLIRSNPRPNRPGQDYILESNVKIRMIN